MAGINYVLKVVDKASKAIKAPGDEAEKASLKIREYEKQLKILNDIEMKNQATYFNYDKDIKYNRSKINSGTLTKEEELSARSEIRDLELKKEESAIKGERISKMISSTEGKLQEQKLLKEMKDNTEGEDKNTRGLGEVGKGIVTAVGGMALVTKATQALEKVIRNAWDQSKTDTRIDIVSGKEGTSDTAKVFADRYGIDIKSASGAYETFLNQFKNDEEMATKYMKLTDFISKKEGKDFGSIAGTISSAIQSGNGNELTGLVNAPWDETVGRGFTNYLKGGDYNGFINSYLEYLSNVGWNEDKYNEIFNTDQMKAERGWQAFKNNISGRGQRRMNIDLDELYNERNVAKYLGQDTSYYDKEIEKLENQRKQSNDLLNTDIFNLPDAPNSLHNNISLMGEGQVDLMAGLGSQVRGNQITKNNNVTINITNNESETPPEKLGEIIDEHLEKSLQNDIEGGSNEFY